MESEATVEARRHMEVCNACRYCEGYCAVFPAMALRREFTSGDLTHLANLCHSCKGCYHSCQYAPPHEFGINLPATFATIRQESYAEYAWPPGMGQVFHKNGTLLAGLAAILVALALILAVGIADPANLYAGNADPGAFYRVIPWGLIVTLAGITFVYSLVALAMGAIGYWRGTKTGSGTRSRGIVIPTAQAIGDVLSLCNLGGGGHGCNDIDEGFSGQRRHLHHAMFYGFMLCFASTAVATLYDHFLGLIAPYGFFSLPVQLGFWGGILLCIGTAGFIRLKIITDPVPVARHLLGGEYTLLILLFLIGATGLLLLSLRGTGAMGILLMIHFGLVLSLFIALPYSKMVHGLYRGLALLRDRREKMVKI